MPSRTLPWLSLAALLAAAPAAHADSIRPGYWATTSTVSSIIDKTKSENRCVTPSAIAKFTGCYINHHYKCDCPEQTNADGRIAFHGVCVDAQGRHVKIDGEGTYTSTTLSMSARGRFQMMGIYVPFSAHTDAHRIGDACPPGAPGEAGR